MLLKGTFYHFASTLPIGMNPLANMDGDLNIWNLSPHPSDDVWTFVGGVASVVDVKKLGSRSFDFRLCMMIQRSTAAYLAPGQSDSVVAWVERVDAEAIDGPRRK